MSGHEREVQRQIPATLARRKIAGEATRSYPRWVFLAPFELGTDVITTALPAYGQASATPDHRASVGDYLRRSQVDSGRHGAKQIWAFCSAWDQEAVRFCAVGAIYRAAFEMLGETLDGTIIEIAETCVLAANGLTRSSIPSVNDHEGS